MAKTKVAYFCQSCGFQSPKWLGKCTSCNSWNTFVEEVLHKEDDKRGEWKSKGSAKRAPKPKAITNIAYEEQERFITEDQELNRVLGDGIVPGSLVLVGGEPGIGKSTLMLQLALSMKAAKILYVSGEESAQQIKMRAERLGSLNENCFVLSETTTQSIFQEIEQLEPQLVIIDSIQTLQSKHIESVAGSVSQVRECTNELMKFAKETNTPVFLIGHITKEGTIAGPKILEHMVDTVLQFEGDRHLAYRILRTVKNRFGSTSELGMYEMRGSGLREVNNPSEILISQREEDLSGITIAASIEGNRPLLVEIQALVSVSSYGTAQRSATGYDLKRLNMLLAVLEKRGGFKLSQQDVFLNIAGGIKIDDPAIDLAVCIAIISSYEDVAISNKVCFAGEVGLGGEIRAVNRVENRISEAEKLGFDEIIVSKYNNNVSKDSFHKIKLHQLSKLERVCHHIFG